MRRAAIDANGDNMSTAQNRFKQANAPSGGSEYTPVTSVGAT